MMVLASVDDTEALGAAIGALLAPGEIVGLTGSLGAGKTVLARGILRGLGFEGDVPSPSFPIVIPYEPPGVRIPVAHVDLYRLEPGDDVGELGLADMLTDGALIIEWPDRLGEDWRSGALDLSLMVADDGARVLTAKVPPAWESRWPPR